jgi:hypothetical protein
MTFSLGEVLNVEWQGTLVVYVPERLLWLVY